MSNFAALEKFLTDNLKTRNGIFVYLFRHSQSMGNHAGTIVGWTDTRLSYKGREDANKLYKALYKNVNNFTHFHSSDLVRCVDTLNICTGLTSLKPTITNQLR